MQSKTEARAFFLSEYEEEKAYLEERHRQGWKLVRVWPYVFRFEACTPEEYVYELDYMPKGADERRQYLTMFQDYGWEHVSDCKQFSYFRKRAGEASQGGGQSLFSDNESRMDLARRIFRRRMLPISILLLVSLLPLVIVAARNHTDAFDIALYVVYAIVLAWDAYALARSARGFARLREVFWPIPSRVLTLVRTRDSLGQKTSHDARWTSHDGTGWPGRASARTGTKSRTLTYSSALGRGFALAERDKTLEYASFVGLWGTNWTGILCAEATQRSAYEILFQMWVALAAMRSCETESSGSCRLRWPPRYPNRL